MEEHTEYRERAATARNAAEEALTPELKASFLRLEANWLRMAATAEIVIPEATVEAGVRTP